MFLFTSYVLQHYYRATGWNDDNLYANLTRSSTAILDFTIPKGLAFCVSKSPNSLFSTTCSMTALPTLNGSIGYIFTSHELKLPNSGDVEFEDVIDRFKVYSPPHTPETEGGGSTAGKRIRAFQAKNIQWGPTDYLMYGRLYIPSGRLDALSTVRFTPALQGIIAGISDLPINASTRDSSRSYDKYDTVNSSNLMLSLQHDTGRWCSEYTWSAEDMMFGIRVLRNFGEPRSSWRSGTRKPDEENGIEGSLGLGGRLSAGAELYFSALEKSAGVSTGIRFTTLPDISSGSDSTCPQPPTTLTAIFNPMIGYISTAYAAQVSQDLSFCSRFNFNVYSYESEWTFGSEWWIRKGVRDNIDSPSGENSIPNVPNDLSGHRSQEIQGVLKAKVSTKMDLSFLWEGRIQNVLVGLGLMSDLSSGSKPIRAVGVELSYFSSD